MGKWKTYILYIILLALVIYFVRSYFTAKSILLGYAYRLPVIIENTKNTNFIGDYSVKIIIDTQSLISAGKMRPDCGDLKVTYIDPDTGQEVTTLRKIERCGRTDTKVTIYIQKVYALRNLTLYIYYGNPYVSYRDDIVPDPEIKDIKIYFGQEEKLLEFDKDYVDIETGTFYERGEIATVYAKVYLDNVNSVILRVVDGNGSIVYEANMTQILPNIYTHSFNTSILDKGTYLFFVYVLSGIKQYGDVQAVRIQTDYSELKNSIESVMSYLTQVIYPELNRINNKLDNLYNLTYSDLLNIKDKLEYINSQISDLQDSVRYTNSTLYEELQYIKQQNEQQLEKLNTIINLINNVVSVKLDSISSNIYDLNNTLVEVRGLVREQVIPQLSSIEFYINIVSNQILELNNTIYSNNREVQDKLDLLITNTNTLLVKVNEAISILNCTDSSIEVCKLLYSIKDRAEDIYGEALNIKQILTDLDSYIRNNLTSKIDDISNRVSDILNRQQESYVLLQSIYSEIQSTKTEIYYLQQLTQTYGGNITSMLNDQAYKLSSIEQKVEQAINLILNEVIPRLNDAQNSLNYSISLINDVKLEVQQTNYTLYLKLSEIQNQLLDINQNISVIISKLQKLDRIDNSILEIISRLDTIAGDLVTIRNNVNYSTDKIDSVISSIENVNRTLTEVSRRLYGGLPPVQALYPIRPDIAAVAFIAIIIAFMVAYYIRARMVV